MKNPLKRSPNAYMPERDRLLEYLKNANPPSDEYQKAMTRLNELDRMINRTSEFTKTLIPALGTVASVAGIYALQQFAGVIVPKALDAIASSSTHKKTREFD